MKLRTLRLRNFRCFQKEILIEFDDLTAFIGKNDVGKSSIMDALDIFLNDGAPDRHDASKGGDGKDLTIICEFDELPDTLVLDEDYETTLAAEHLLNSRHRLEIHKKFSGHLQKPACVSTSLF